MKLQAINSIIIFLIGFNENFSIERKQQEKGFEEIAKNEIKIDPADINIKFNQKKNYDPSSAKTINKITQKNYNK